MKNIKLLMLFTFLFIASSESSKAIKLDFSNQGITDDAMAKTIKHTKPTTIKHDILDKMDEHLNFSYPQKSYTLQEITELDFSSNFLTSVGALDIVNFLFDNQNQFKTLKILKLSYNRISEDDEYDAFEQNLLNFIALFPSTKVDLTGNYLSPQRLLRDHKLRFLKNEHLENSPHIIFKKDISVN